MNRFFTLFYKRDDRFPLFPIQNTQAALNAWGPGNIFRLQNDDNSPHIDEL